MSKPEDRQEGFLDASSELFEFERQHQASHGTHFLAA